MLSSGYTFNIQIMHSISFETRPELQLIVDRRNKIAHEADADPSFPGARWPLSTADVEGATKFIEELCEAIHAVI
jgi:hypothetical protein